MKKITYSAILLSFKIKKKQSVELLEKENLVGLGDSITNKKLKPSSDEQITFIDLTGVAVQNIQISAAVHEALFS